MPKPRANPLQEMDLQPIYDQEMETVWQWLGEHQLVALGGTMDLAPGDLPEGDTYDGASVVIAEATQRSPVRRNTQDELKGIKERFKDTTPTGVTPESVWGAVKDPRAKVRKLDWQRLPADAMAFYRPFHYPPFDQWGIYLLTNAFAYNVLSFIFIHHKDTKITELITCFSLCPSCLCGELIELESNYFSELSQPGADRENQTRRAAAISCIFYRGHAMNIHAEYIVDENLNKKAVIIPYSEWKVIMEEIEELDDIRAYDQVKNAIDDEDLPFQQALQEINAGKIE
ncbi:hypothetical protein G3480_25430 [Thiorhodococcus mannitoliphagus]|uniref:Uncharacterized protein n=1 Tax=Thiorhodococcus mannitoliphagus TaxID=329406 RepID=A0A6P1DZB5_9GAMM|nr:hypothetical protein [Thiorhodococcus mannitoliphagus]NEX23578.1 hypothetical protein [Thiorhodococcus mannitoliphagus]